MATLPDEDALNAIRQHMIAKLQAHGDPGGSVLRFRNSTQDKWEVWKDKAREEVLREIRALYCQSFDDFFLDPEKFAQLTHHELFQMASLVAVREPEDTRLCLTEDAYEDEEEESVSASEDDDSDDDHDDDSLVAESAVSIDSAPSSPDESMIEFE